MKDLEVLTPEQIDYYKAYLRIAFTTTYIAHDYAKRAQDVLRESGAYYIEEKKTLHKALTELAKLEDLSNKTLKKDRRDFFKDIYFMDELVALIISKVKTEKQEDALLSFIKEMSNE